MERRRGWAVAGWGMLVIASTYGMARFGVGLYAPRLVAERPALDGVVGLAAAAQFVSYAVAAGLAARWGDAWPRRTLALAGAAATAGCAGVALATTPAVFVAAVFVGGTGAGFASPALVRLVDDTVAARSASTAQSVVNSGTAVGVAAAGGLALAVTATGPAWTVMAVTCAVAAGGLLLLARAPSGTPAPATARERPRGLTVPVAAAFVTGAGSALVWTFGPLVATTAGAVADDRVGLLWIALGLGGLLGPVTGAAVARGGVRVAWAGFAGLVVLADLVLLAALALQDAWSAFAATALFGAGYMCLSGVLILWARTLAPAAAGAGTSVLFVALALGQALGSAGFDVLLDHTGAVPAVLLAALLGVVGAALGAARPVRVREQSDPAPCPRTASRP